MKNRPSFDFLNISFTSTATQTIPYPLLSSLQIVHSNPPVVNSPLNIPSTTILTLSPPPPPRNMAARYAPLVLPQNLGAMPTDYQTKIPLFDSTQTITTQQHVDTMNAFFDLHEVEIEDVSMRLFLQSFGA